MLTLTVVPHRPDRDLQLRVIALLSLVGGLLLCLLALAPGLPLTLLPVLGVGALAVVVVPASALVGPLLPDAIRASAFSLLVGTLAAGQAAAAAAAGLLAVPSAPARPWVCSLCPPSPPDCGTCSCRCPGPPRSCCLPTLRRCRINTGTAGARLTAGRPRPPVPSHRCCLRSRRSTRAAATRTPENTAPDKARSTTGRGQGRRTCG